jgi:hypothetical protein
MANDLELSPDELETDETETSAELPVQEIHTMALQDLQRIAKAAAGNNEELRQRYLMIVRAYGAVRELRGATDRMNLGHITVLENVIKRDAESLGYIA